MKGHRVIATSRNPAKSPEKVSEIEGLGGKWLSMDVTSAGLEAQVKAAESVHGRIDVLVNNAGYSVLGAVEDISDKDAAAQMDANFMGPFRVMKAVLPGMRARRSGTILNISSAQGLCPSPVCGIYAASKGALENLSESLAVEVEPFGIRVLIVEPGAFRTSFSSSTNAGYVLPTADYANEDHPVAKRFAQLKAFDGTARGDPEAGAKVMFEAVTGEGEAGKLIHMGKFLRLIIGPDCWQRADGKVTELRRTVDLQKDLAASTDL
jgi:NAD(P)-dependent dehydrogenase (short-subunit alcohol dehydrogenase family)